MIRNAGYPVRLVRIACAAVDAIDAGAVGATGEVGSRGAGSCPTGIGLVIRGSLASIAACPSFGRIRISGDWIGIMRTRGGLTGGARLSESRAAKPNCKSQHYKFQPHGDSLGSDLSTLQTPNELPGS
jgi:hypothetical protein